MTDTRPYELSVLKAIFNRETARYVVSKATSKHFSDEDTLAVFKAFQRLHFGSTPVTPESLLLEIVSVGSLESPDASAVIEEITQTQEPPSVTHAITGLGLLQSRKQLQGLAEFITKPEAFKDGMAPAVAAINNFILTHHTVSAKKPETLTEALHRAVQRTEPQKTWDPGMGLGKYWKIRKGSYSVVGGDSGSGKTAMLVNMVLEVAKQGSHAGVISLEMSTDELTYRAAAIEAGIEHERFEDNILSRSELDTIMHQLRENAEVYDRIHVVDPAFFTAEQIQGQYGELVSRYGCEVVFVDYIQRITSGDRTVHSKMDSVSKASEVLTGVTKATGVATVALSVLARDQHGNKSKGLHHLKHSGQIGHDASTVVILTPEVGDPDDEEKTIRIDCVKNRKGRFFSEAIILHGPTQRMTHAGYSYQGDSKFYGRPDEKQQDT